MRLLHIIDSLNPAHGGPAEGVRLLLRYREPALTAEVVTLDPPDAPFLRDLDFTVHALGTAPVAQGYGLQTVLYRWLRQNRDNYDAFLVNGLWQFCGLATMLALRRRRRYVVFSHGMLDPWFKREYPLKHVKKIPYWYLAEYWILRNAYRVLFTTTAEASLARKSFGLYHWRPAIVPYGVEGPPGPPEQEETAFRELCPEVAGRRYLLFLGRMHVKKGCDLLVRAFGELAQNDPDLHLVMAGPDQQGLVAELQEITRQTGCEARVHWPGMLQGDAKWGAFRLAEAFVLPSHQENFGIAVAEALACGTPVLLSRQINIAQEIEYDGSGFVADDTLAGTRRLLSRWMGTSHLERQRMRAQAFSTFRMRYNAEQNARRLVRLLDTAPVRHGRRRGEQTDASPAAL